MHSALIREAADHLHILGLTLGSNSTAVSDDFNPRTDVGETSIDLHWGPKKASLLSVDFDGGKKGQIWIVVFSTRAKLFEGLKPTSGDDDPRKLLTEFTADFLMQYIVDSAWTINQDALHEFTQHNTPIHVWPYWREWLQSNAMRIGLPPVVLTMHMLPPSNEGRPVPSSATK